MIQEVVGDAHLGLTRPDEAWDVLGVDLRRRDLVAGRDALGVHGRQRPSLTSEEVPAIVVHIQRAVQVTDARVPGV